MSTQHDWLKSAIYTVNKIEGGHDITALGDKGLRYRTVKITMESHSSYPTAIFEVEVETERQQKYKIGDFYKVYYDDTKHTWTIEKENE